MVGEVGKGAESGESNRSLRERIFPFRFELDIIQWIIVVPTILSIASKKYKYMRSDLIRSGAGTTTRTLTRRCSCCGRLRKSNRIFLIFISPIYIRIYQTKVYAILYIYLYALKVSTIAGMGLVSPGEISSYWLATLLLVKTLLMSFLQYNSKNFKSQNTNTNKKLFG